MTVRQGPQPLVRSGISQMQMVIEWPLQPSQSIYTQLLGVTLRVEFDLVMLCTQGTCNPILGKLRVVVGTKLCRP